jgi:glutamine---fructose-6-phosphate transaminase (isomerizing)
VTTAMALEALEAADVVERQFLTNTSLIEQLASRLRTMAPQHVVTIARGSSDHAASFFGYLVMARIGKWVTSLPMSLVTMEDAPLSGQNVAVFSFSQSGKSPDLIAPTEMLRNDGALTIALVNVGDSPLAHASDTWVPLNAGPEKSVAATKSFIAQLAAGVHILGAWSDDSALLSALPMLPATLRAAAKSDWSRAVPALSNAERLFVIGRGAGLAIAHEAALKFKETCGIQAEAFSGAEVKHGPMALIEEGYPLLVFAPRGASQAGLLTLAHEMRARGANVMLAAPRTGGPHDADIDLPMETAAHPVLDPISAIQSFYPLVEAVSRARGMNPDAPRHLAKVTLTH